MILLGRILRRMGKEAQRGVVKPAQPLVNSKQPPTEGCSFVLRSSETLQSLADWQCQVQVY